MRSIRAVKNIGAMKALRTLRALARVEVRQLLLYPRRSLLVMLLVAVPVAAVVGGSTLAQITERTVEEQRTQTMGAAPLRVDGIEHRDHLERARTLLPPEARIADLFVGVEEVSVPGTRLRGKLIAIDSQALEPGGLAHGMVVFKSGRAPRNAGEVALSPVLLEGLDRRLGDQVVLEYGPLRTITAVVVDPEQLDLPLVVRPAAAVEHRGRHSLLVELPGNLPEGSATATTLREAGLRPSLRAEVGGRSDTGRLILALGILGFFEAALVIAAAFAVSIRRRQREIGLLGATGATVHGLWSSLLMSAATVALVGGVVGTVAGTALAALLHPFLDGWNQRFNGGFEVSTESILAGVLLGLLTAVLAAAIPARGAARLPIRLALGGRRPPTADARSWLRVGIFLVLLGILLTSMARSEHTAAAVLGVLVGPVLGIVGFGLCSPWLLDVLARRAAPLPLSWRLAVRDAGRFRSRNGPVVTAILAGMSMSMTLAILVTSIETAIDLIPATYREDQLLVEGTDAEAVARRIATELSAVAVAPWSIAYTGGEPVRAQFTGGPTRRFVGETIAIGNEDFLRAMGAEAAREPFTSGRLVALDPAPEPAELRLTSWLGDRPLTSPSLFRSALDQRLREPAFLLHEEALAEYGMEPGPPIRRTLTPWLVRLPQPVTRRDLARSQALAAASVGTSVDAALLHQRPAKGFYYVVLGLCVFTGLVIVLIANALTAAESAGDERVLHAVGAAPSLVRRHLAARAAYLAALGCILAVPGGLLPTMGLLRAAKLPMEMVVPWHAVASTLLVLPAVAYLGAWLLSAARRRSPARMLEAACLALALGAMLPQAVHASPDGVDRMEHPAEIRWEPFLGEAFDGSPLEGELGRLTVPENRNASGNATIELAFVRYRTTNPNPGPPIFFLVGGPGGAGTEHGGKFATHPQIRLLEHRDVIALDQRGTGLTRPNLVDQEFRSDLPLNQAISRQQTLAAFRRAVVDCTDHWTAAGVDLRAYNSVESADDVEAVRRALGLDQIMLLGSSYGSHLGLAYLRRHGDHVSRAVLLKVEGPDHTWKLPSTVQTGLEQLHASVLATPHLRQDLPNLLHLVQTLKEQLEEWPLKATATTTAPAEDENGEVSMVLGPFDFQVMLSYALSSTEGIAALPRQLYAMSQGDWSPLAASAVEHRRLGINGMTLLMDCMSGGSPARRQRIERERLDPANLLGDAIMAPLFPQSCEAISPAADLGDAYRGPLSTDVPVLFVSGSLDIRTPPANVEDIRGGFSNHAHVVVENASHGGRELMSPEYRRILQAFLRGEEIVSQRIVLPRVRLEPVNPLQ